MANIDYEKLAEIVKMRGVNITPEYIQKAVDKADAATRAITNPATSPFTSFDVEDLVKTSVVVTPFDTPLLNRLRGKVNEAISQTFSWVESTSQTNHTLVKYDGNTPPSDVNGAGSIKSNYVMPIATVPKVGRFVNSLKSVDQSAMRIELRDKYTDINKGLEYYLWNGNEDTVVDSLPETDGIIERVTTAVDNGGGNVEEEAIQTAVLQIAAAGGRATHIFANHTKAQRIANFTLESVRENQRNRATNGIGESALTYLNPFGPALEVVPTFDEYIPTGKIYVLDLNHISLRSTMAQLINLEKLGIITHGDAMIYFSFFGIQIEGNTRYHRVITNCANGL
jgi:hypothetical protein